MSRRNCPERSQTALGGSGMRQIFLAATILLLAAAPAWPLPRRMIRTRRPAAARGPPEAGGRLGDALQRRCQAAGTHLRPVAGPGRSELEAVDGGGDVPHCAARPQAGREAPAAGRPLSACRREAFHRSERRPDPEVRNLHKGRLSCAGAALDGALLQRLRREPTSRSAIRRSTRSRSSSR